MKALQLGKGETSCGKSAQHLRVTEVYEELLFMFESFMSSEKEVERVRQEKAEAKGAFLCLYVVTEVYTK